MTAPTQANPGLSSSLTGYDDSGHQTNVAFRMKNVTTDGTTGVVSGDIGADVEVAVSTGVTTTTLYTTALVAGGSGNSGDLDVSKLRELSIDITTSLVTTNLQFFYERKGADNLYYPLWQSAVLTASANTISTSIGPGLAYNQSLGVTGRLRWVATGNASFTPNIFGK